MLHADRALVLLARDELIARNVLGWPKICKLAHAFLWEYSYKRLKLAQLLGQLGVLLTFGRGGAAARADQRGRAGPGGVELQRVGEGDEGRHQHPRRRDLARGGASVILRRRRLPLDAIP